MANAEKLKINKNWKALVCSIRNCKFQLYKRISLIKMITTKNAIHSAFNFKLKIQSTKFSLSPMFNSFCHRLLRVSSMSLRSKFC